MQPQYFSNDRKLSEKGRSVKVFAQRVSIIFSVMDINTYLMREVEKAIQRAIGIVVA
jgi:hypothetical protein